LVSGNDTINNALTDTSVPAAFVYNANAGGNLFMSKPITNVVNNEDGTVSFLFMGGDTIPNSISNINRAVNCGNVSYYDLTGRRAGSVSGVFIVRQQDGTARKIVR
jgi:hypothetical protein